MSSRVIAVIRGRNGKPGLARIVGCRSPSCGKTFKRFSYEKETCPFCKALLVMVGDVASGEGQRVTVLYHTEGDYPLSVVRRDISAGSKKMERFPFGQFFI